MGVETDSKGTARGLHEFSRYEALEDEYGEETAVSLTTKALQRADSRITKGDTRSSVKVFRLMMGGSVDIAAEHQRAMSSADKAAVELVEGIRKGVKLGDGD